MHDYSEQTGLTITISALYSGVQILLVLLRSLFKTVRISQNDFHNIRTYMSQN